MTDTRTCAICGSPAPSLVGSQGLVYCADCRQADRGRVASHVRTFEEGKAIFTAGLAELRTTPQEERTAAWRDVEAEYLRTIADLDLCLAHYRGLLAALPTEGACHA
jgi:hypothetical protein